MTGLSDAAVARLRAAAAWPEFDSPRYAVVEEIGRGGMGTVYRAFDAVLGRDVALKVPNGFGDAAVGRRLKVEATVVARLEHPGIVPIHDAGTLADGRRFYVMKLVRGQTLRDHLAVAGDTGGRLGVFERICEPVAFAHARGVLHRDLKPENVMLGPFGEVLVMDWGAALAAPERDGRQAGEATGIHDAPAGEIVGTHGFMAPEQTAGAETDARADVYGLGAVLFFMLTGHAPSRGDPAATLASLPGIPGALRSICARALAADPGERYQDVTSLALDVRRYRAGLPVSAHQASLAERAARFGRTHRTAILLVVAYIVMRTMVALMAGR